MCLPVRLLSDSKLIELSIFRYLSQLFRSTPQATLQTTPRWRQQAKLCPQLLHEAQQIEEIQDLHPK